MATGVAPLPLQAPACLSISFIRSVRLCYDLLVPATLSYSSGPSFEGCPLLVCKHRWYVRFDVLPPDGMEAEPLTEIRKGKCSEVAEILDGIKEKLRTCPEDLSSAED